MIGWYVICIRYWCASPCLVTCILPLWLWGRDTHFPNWLGNARSGIQGSQNKAMSCNLAIWKQWSIFYHCPCEPTAFLVPVLFIRCKTKTMKPFGAPCDSHTNSESLAAIATTLPFTRSYTRVQSHWDCTCIFWVFLCNCGGIPCGRRSTTQFVSLHLAPNSSKVQIR